MRILTVHEVWAISTFPMAVLSDNLGSPVAGAIKGHTSGAYNHFMWLIGPGIIASQDWFFKQVSVGEYLEGEHRLKIWHNPAWTQEERVRILDAIWRDLQKPWYRKLYDWPAIVGQALDLPWLQIPGIDICSDKGRHLAVVDPRYCLVHPDPQDINAWLQATDGYEVYGRFIPD